MAQAEDRCHRVGQSNSVQVEYYVFKNTIDEWVAQSLLSKQSNIDQILPIKAGSNPSTSSYTFDFGKHAGLRLEDAPFTYVQYLVLQEVWRQRPKLWRALFFKGMVQESPLSEDGGGDSAGVGSVDEAVVASAKEPSAPALGRNVPSDTIISYKFDFGKYSGEIWENVPQSYRDWIVKEGVWKNRADLKTVLLGSGIVQDDMTNDLLPGKQDMDASPLSMSSSQQHPFPIKSFRLTVQCSFIIKELEARNISFDAIERGKISKLKKRLLEWHVEQYPTDAKREITLLSCNHKDLLAVSKIKQRDIF